MGKTTRILPKYLQNYQNMGKTSRILAKYQNLKKYLQNYQNLNKIPPKLPESRGAWGNIPQTTRIKGGMGAYPPNYQNMGEISRFSTKHPQIKGAMGEYPPN